MNALALMLVLGAGQAVGEEAPVATVTVRAAKERVVTKLDRTVHDVSAMPKAANGSAQDVLQAIPDVSVTGDGRISVRGNAQVTVLVDGKPAAALAGEERAVALQTMSGADIASVEVVTNPSAAHGANGGAILNIVLKRDCKPGARAQARASVSDRSLWNAGVSGDVTRAHLSVHGSLALRHDGNLKLRRAETDWRDVRGETGHMLQASGVFVRRTVASAALGLEYALGPADTLSLSARHNERRSRPLLDTFNLHRSGAADTTFHRISHGPNEQRDHNASLSYSLRGEGTALKASLQRSATDGLIDKVYRDEFAGHIGEHGRNVMRSARRLDQASVDWSSTAGGGQWGAGLDLQDETNDLSHYQAQLDPLAGAETPDPGTTGAYAVATTQAAAYLTDRMREGPWEALLGARFERLVQRVGAVERRTQGIQPSVHLRYVVSDARGLSFSYRRSLARPDPRDLNPHTTYIDAHNRSRGNPALGPQRMSTWEIGASAETAKLSGNVAAFYRASRDTIVEAHSAGTGGVLLTSKENGGQARSFGMTGSLDWTVNERVRLGADGGAYRLAFARRQGTAGYANLRAACSAGMDEVSVDAQVQSSSITPLGRNGATSSVNLTWKRRLNRTLSLTINASDLFDGSRRSWRTDSGALRQAGVEHVAARRIYLGVLKQFE